MNHKSQLLKILEEESQNPLDFLEGIVEHSGVREDALVQLFCIYKFKYDLGKKYDRKTEWEESSMEWATSTCAADFREAYNKRCNIHTIYERATSRYDFTPVR